MKIILLQDVDSLGRAGDTVETRDGYSRNFLLPRKLAVLSTEGGLRFLDAKKKQAAQKSERLKEEARELSSKLEKIPFVIKAKVGQEGKLFGAVTTQDILQELEKHGVQIERRRIEMAPIHQLGEYRAIVKLHPEVDVSIKVTVKA